MTTPTAWPCGLSALAVHLHVGRDVTDVVAPQLNQPVDAVQQWGRFFDGAGRGHGAGRPRPPRGEPVARRPADGRPIATRVPDTPNTTVINRYSNQTPLSP
jgi:hypothetical protein